MNIVFLHVNKDGLQKRTASHSKAWKSYDEDKVYPKGVFQIDLDTNTFKGINVRASYWDAEEFVEKVSTYQQLINQLEKAGYTRSA